MPRMSRGTSSISFASAKPPPRRAAFTTARSGFSTRRFSIGPPRRQGGPAQARAAAAGTVEHERDPGAGLGHGQPQASLALVHVLRLRAARQRADPAPREGHRRGATRAARRAGQGQQGSRRRPVRGDARSVAPVLVAVPAGRVAVPQRQHARAAEREHAAEGLRPVQERGGDREARRHPRPAARVRHPSARSGDAGPPLQRALGHRRLESTMRYVHWVSEHRSGADTRVDLVAELGLAS